MIRSLARPLLASIFVVQGLDTVKHPGARAQVAAPLLDRLVPMLGLPDDKVMLVRANGVAMLVGGALLGAGRLPRPAAALLAGALVPTTLAGHAYWTKSDPAERSAQRTQFLKNLGLLGGLLLAAVDTDGNPSVAWHARRLREQTAARIADVREARA
ncbi:MAG TPA: DoxX family membrane protein [Dermatophilaceae bacterium]|nr:DoxX family membrane protein [Dermatophilaceae bacterium]